MTTNVVQNPARSSLSDDGFRSWSEEAKELLDEKYPGWKKLKETIMVPPELPYKSDSGHLAEKKIFDLLGHMGNIEKEGGKEPMFVIHAHQFSELRDGVSSSIAKKWMIGEHDIVVLHYKYGPIFMQVKAGSTPKEYAKAKEQLQKDKQATAAYLKKNFEATGKVRRESAKALFDYPGFVVMPNCSKAKSSGRAGLFKEDCESVDAFVAWWDTNVKMETPTEGFTQEIYEHLVERFVGHLEKVPYLSEDIDETCKILNFATTEQWKVMQQSPPEQWITGPAGSGKTWLLQEKVVELASQSYIYNDHKKILVLCYNRPLAQHLEKQFQIKLKDFLEQSKIPRVSSIIDVMTYDKFVCSHFGSTIGLNDYAKKRLIIDQYTLISQGGKKPPCSYRHIFVDEGQDMYGTVWPELLELCLEKYGDNDESLDSHYFWVMFDSNQNVQPSADNFKCFKEHLRRSSKLTKVLRNTGHIHEVSRKYYQSELCQEIQLGHHVAGLNVKWNDSLPDAIEERLERGSALVAQHIQELWEEKVQPNDICILTTDRATGYDLSFELIKRGINCQNAEGHISTGEQRIIVESIRRFKGLESKVVILFDPTNTKTRGQSKELLYSAITRCFCLLVVVSTSSDCELIRSFVKEKQSSPSRKRGLNEASEASEGKRPAFKIWRTVK